MIIDWNCCVNKKEPNFARFDALELHAVHCDESGNCEPVHDDVTPVSFYSLYGHIDGEGVECLHDFSKDEKDSEAVYLKSKNIADKVSLPLFFG